MTIVKSAELVTLVPSGVWEVDPARSIAGFSVRHLKVTNVRGRFHEIAGVIRCDRDGVSSIDGSVDVTSIDTGDRRRDTRLCAEDFFDAERYPAISFMAISPPAGLVQAHVVNGTLTVRGVSRPLVLQLHALGSPADGNDGLRIRATGVISRRAFGLTWDSAFAAGGLVIDDRVGLQLEVALSRKS
jgi:polyisoprenoid-binding protein YceI